MSLSTVQVERESVGAIEGIIMNGHRTVIEHDCCHAANADEVLVAVAASEALQEIQSIGAVDQSGKLASLGKKMGDDLDLDRTFAAIHIDHDKAAVSREATMTMVKDDNEQVNGREKEVTRREEREQKEEEEEEEEEEEVESMWVRRFDIGNGLPLIRLEEEWGAGLGGVIWETSVLLTRCLSCEEICQRSDFKGKRCIELGSGCGGLSGIAAAHMGFKEVILTDVEECLETLASNVRANCPAKDFEVVVNFPNQAIGITGYGEIPPPRTSSLSSPRVTSNPKQEPSASTTAPVAIGTPAAVPDGPESGLRNRTSSVPDGAASVPDGLGVDHVGGEKGPISGSGTSLGKEGTAWSATAEEKNLASVCASAVDESDDDDDDGDDRLGEMETKNPKLIEPRNNVGLCNGCKSGGGISDGLAVREKTVSDVRTERTVVRVEELDWYRGVDHVKPPFDYIIASDVVYSVAMVGPLISTLCALSHKDTKIFIAHMSRDRRACSTLWKTVPEYFHCTKVPDSLFAQVPGGCGNHEGVFLWKIKS